MKEIKNLGKGFTLIELLVVISIIGILATLLMANLTSTRGRARDAQRKSDLRNIQTALRLYYNDFNKYPGDDSNVNIAGCGDGTEACEWGNGGFEVTTKDTYMNLLPQDPSGDRTYYYHYNNDDDYVLEACLENKSDSNCGVDCTSTLCSDPGCTDAPSGCIYQVKP